MQKSYIPDLYRFLRDIDRNNNRPWFLEHRADYDRLRAQWIDDLTSLLGHMSAWDPAFARITAQQATYRFNRDTRFSTNKDPYKTYFSAAFGPTGDKNRDAGYYLHLGPDDTSHGDAIPAGIYAGIYCPDSAILRKLRHAVIDNIEEFTDIISEPEFAATFPEWTGTPLKTAPKGWPKDHPHIDLLRLTEYGRFHPLSEEFFTRPDWTAEVSRLFAIARPLVDFLNYSIHEDIDTPSLS